MPDGLTVLLLMNVIFILQGHYLFQLMGKEVTATPTFLHLSLYVILIFLFLFLKRIWDCLKKYITLVV
ncbi:hypothetical protein DXB10_21070 [Escherichia coli]|nr:hypothetical protein [Escherichia coli]EZA17644.1 hypothetical protein BW75_18575 [Escherichia coli O81:NM str. 02-3012]KQI95599.1 hypothetical protein AM262_19005 [Escherichia coli]RGO36486.1 hypothetical protein DXB20_20565 [Escherichia coli]RGO44884.1 hypothetical protein DXB13_20705 [Escherichia coli]